MNDYSQAIIGNQIKKYRKAKNLSQQKLAELINVSPSYISEIERGGKTQNSSISMKNICKIAEVLEISLDEIAHTNISCNRNTSNKNKIQLMKTELETLTVSKLNLFKSLISLFEKD